MQRWVVICSWAVLAVALADECPDGGQCNDEQTCCKHPSNGYECCPFDKAECCEDHVHCCPFGTMCDVAKSSCVNATASVAWAERSPVKQSKLYKSFRMIKSYIGEDDDNICPDHSRCPSEFSCLRALTKYGCCPLAQGVPCADGKHCCPKGHSCSKDSHSCIKKDVVTTVMCSDGISECPDESSCCEGDDGQFGCCPMLQAECCEDKIHCCPEGSSCDLEHTKCISVLTKKELPMWAKFPARKRDNWENQNEEQHSETANEEKESPTPDMPDQRVSNVTCDQTKACLDGQTCCPDGQGGWGCCPLPNAVCCSDHQSCCPSGTTCDVAHQQCLESSSMSSKPAAVTTATSTTTESEESTEQTDTEEEEEDSEDDEEDEDNDVEHRHNCTRHRACPRNSTCCRFGRRKWGCCPLHHAVCCSDGKHCCPHHHKCNHTHQACVRDDGVVIPWYTKLPALSTLQPKRSAAVTTAAPTTTESQESTEQTDTEEEDYEDDEEDEDDDVEHRQNCTRHRACPRNSTCCRCGRRKWGCCPLNHAVCCSDGKHCCPHHHKCNHTHQACVRDDGVVIPWYTKLPALPTLQPKRSGIVIVVELEERVSNITCDQTTACLDGQTCCPDGQGGWGCCPLPNAVCCSDHQSCCPFGTTCDVAHEQCLESSSMSSKPAAVTTAAPTTTESQESTEQTDTEEEEDSEEDDDEEEDEDNDVEHRHNCTRHRACPRNSTCCRFGRRKWGCCPLHHAVCCSDGKHCCPHHHKCNHTHQACVRDDGVVIPWYTKLPALSTLQPKRSGIDIVVELEERVSNITCDQTTACLDGQTCCPDGQGGWGCCPLPNAVCCSDHQSCCPFGTTCDVAHEQCLESSSMSSKPAAVTTATPTTTESQESTEQTDTEEEEEDSEEDDDEDDEDDRHVVRCDHHTSCPKGSTCCRLGHKWGCCPLPDAVCCSDGKHCCPHHHKCSHSHKACVRDDHVVIPWYTKLPALSSLETASDNDYMRCKDGKRCPSYNTCCLLSSGEYGCCPMENAVCCSDKKHCCPRDYSCNTESELCERSIVLQVEFVQLTPAQSEPVMEASVKCGGTTCPDSTKCCTLGVMFFCCPYPNGVCCSNNYNCCPFGFKCDKRGLCTNSLVPWDNWPFFRREEKKPLFL